MENNQNETLNNVKNTVLDNMKWYAIYCVSNQEKITKTNIERELRRRNLDSWVSEIEVPVEKVSIKSRGKNVLREKILLPCYIFINADITNGEVLSVIKQTRGVIGFINPSDGKSSLKPEALKEIEVVKFLRKGMDEENFKLKFYCGDNVKIIDGAFNSFVGVVENVDNNKKTLKVIVKIFSRDTVVELEFYQVEKI
jgi:transcriptional antiterminator NusG